jgi:hypothetical protein
MPFQKVKKTHFIYLFICLVSITIKTCYAQYEKDLKNHHYDDGSESRNSQFSYNSQNLNIRSSQQGHNFFNRPHQPQNVRQQMRRGQRQRHNKHGNNFFFFFFKKKKIKF